MGAERGGPSEQKGRVEKFFDKMQMFGWYVFAGLQAVAIATANPALSYAATQGALWDVTFDTNRKAAGETFGKKKKAS